MTGQDDERDDDGESAGSKAEPGDGGRRRKLLLIVSLFVLLGLAGGGAWAYKSGKLDSLMGAPGPEQAEQAAVAPPVFYDLPEILVDLERGAGPRTYLKLRAGLELDGPAAVIRIDGDLPVIIDSFETYLRDLRVDDLADPTSMAAFRADLVVQINRRLKDPLVKDVLFKEMVTGTAG